MVECTNLTKTYKKKRVVDGLSFRVETGEVFAFLGSNGAGKTTTIKMMLGLTRIDGGSVRIDKGARVGYSPETPYFPPFLTGKETLLYYAGLQNIPKADGKAQAARLLETVGLEDIGTRVSRYSKGMLQRLALAQALLGDPDLLILDEPTAGLDALGRHEIMLLIGNLKSLGKTIIINSHILNDVERVCDRGIIIKNGRKVGEWRSSDNDSRSLEEMFIEFVGGERNDDSPDRV